MSWVSNRLRDLNNRSIQTVIFSFSQCCGWSLSVWPSLRFARERTVKIRIISQVLPAVTHDFLFHSTDPSSGHPLFVSKGLWNILPFPSNPRVNNYLVFGGLDLIKGRIIWYLIIPGEILNFQKIFSLTLRISGGLLANERRTTWEMREDPWNNL